MREPRETVSFNCTICGKEKTLFRCEFEKRKRESGGGSSPTCSNRCKHLKRKAGTFIGRNFGKISPAKDFVRMSGPTALMRSPMPNIKTASNHLFAAEAKEKKLNNSRGKTAAGRDISDNATAEAKREKNKTASKKKRREHSGSGK